MTVINTNVASLNAQAALASNARGLSKAMEQLSTGKRISSAADDAAGLAISTRLTSQIRGLNQAVRNGNDGISLIQIGEGALVEVTNMLQRMRELAVQSANDTNTVSDRSFLDLEFQQLKTEITRIGSTVEWNGTKLLNGNFDGTNDSLSFQVGANADQTITLNINDMRSTRLAEANSTAIGVVDQTVAAASTAATVAIGASAEARLAAGDVVTLKVNGKQVQYELQTDDIHSTAGETLAAVQSGLAAASGYSALGATIATAATGLTIGSTAAGEVYSLVVHRGELAQMGGLEITTQDLSNSALSSVDSLLDTVNSQRASMGATINRLQYTVDNLTNVSTRSSEARSRIEDTNYAQATMELAKRQIIQQAATAMLAQANQQPQQVLTLLK